MRHQEIEEHQLIDRYLMGKLPPEEAARFEEHYLSCPQCLQELEWGEKMARGFKETAARPASGGQGSAADQGRAGNRRRQTLNRWPLLAAAAVLASLLILPPLLLYRQMSRLDQKLSQARQELLQTRQSGGRQESLQQELEEVRTRLAEQQQASEEQQKRLQGQLDEERSARRQMARDFSEAFRPQTNTPVFPLSPLRSAAGSAEPDQIVRLSSRPEWVVFSLELESPRFQAYRAVLRQIGQERPLWEGDGLAPNYMDALTVSFHSSFLKPGDYQLQVLAPPSAGKTAPLARFTFRVSGPE